MIALALQAVKDMDKRIHFALNCGAKSCPPIKLFSPDTLEEGLQSAATAFCQGGQSSSGNLSKNTAMLLQTLPLTRTTDFRMESTL